MKDHFRKWAEKKATEILKLQKRYPGGPDVWWASIVQALIEARQDGMAQTKLGRFFPKIEELADEIRKVVAEAVEPPDIEIDLSAKGTPAFGRSR